MSQNVSENSFEKNKKEIERVEIHEKDLKENNPIYYLFLEIPTRM